MRRHHAAVQRSAVRATVSGQVQGVGFRDATVARARELGVLGWVRHREDGGVWVHAEGEREAVDALVAFLHQGPAEARVEAVELERAKVEGHEQFAVRGVSAGAFSVRERADGYELRLEVDGADRVWRVPKEPSMRPADKRMALGGGVAGAPAEGAVWDAGAYEQGGRVPWPEALERGHAVFVLHGERLRGGFALQRTRGTQWLLVKRRDAYAAP
jgi:acylphosphatase